MKGHLRRRGENTWAFVVDIAPDAFGKRRQKWRTVHGTKREAETEMRRVLREIDTNTFIDPAKNVTVGDFLERWLTFAQPNLAHKTHERYAEIVRTRITPALGQIPIAKLTTLQLDETYTAWLKTGHRNGGGLSKRTVLSFHRLIRCALVQARRWKLVMVNVADDASPPSPDRAAMRALEPPAIATLLKAAESSPYYPQIFVALATGVRRGEVLALRWSNLDTSNGILSVREALEIRRAPKVPDRLDRRERDLIAFKTTKSGRDRAIRLGPEVLEVFRRQRVAQNAHRLRYGERYAKHELIFANPDGSPIHPDLLTQAFGGIVKRAKIGHLRLHDLRHSFASLLVGKGVPMKIVSEMLGHSTIAITADTYSHITTAMQDGAAVAIDDVLSAALRPANAAHA